MFLNDGSTVESVYCSVRGPEFSSQKPCWVLHNHLYNSSSGGPDTHRQLHSVYISIYNHTCVYILNLFLN